MSLEELIGRAHAWIAGDPDPDDAAELEALVARREEAELAERMAGPLEFGTAGLRGVLGAGESRMNRAVVIRTGAGLARHVLASVEGAAGRGFVVGCDGRRLGRAFAEETARVLAGAGLRVHLFRGFVPTPLVAFAVRELGAAGGVMVTASHNPPEYNGYKVYWSDGAQIVPPHDRAIAAAIAGAGPAREVPRPPLEEARARGLVLDVPDETLTRYREAVAALSLDRRGRDLVRIVFTPMHGVSDPFVRDALARFGFECVTSVPEQRAPDPEFSTVTLPNPEEPGALDLALDLARRERATLVLANDPDGDRLAVAVPSTLEGGWRQLTGNEIGILLGEHLLRRADEPGAAPRLVATTVVSSPALGVMARYFGAGYEETLTGFKWIATAAMRRETETGERFLFGYEEALGYTVGTAVRDKDGVSAAAVFAELTALAAVEGRSIEDELERIARAHGLFASRQVSLVRKGLEGAAEIRATMDRLRASRPARIGAHDVLAVRDVERGLRRDRDGCETELALPRSNVLAFDLDGGARVVARPSGTEPKIKFYFDLREAVAEAEPHGEARARALGRLDALEQSFLELAGR